ncbi:50S ribosomal protein L17 [Neoactinobaculum massilliense]|uniref:50S ribosomal protein L17 n=1 Tax=Neoactinobaculum massilliense TaxID=2364794 RepID=UPI000F52090A|nr:50S ribosomal protein L17 [Neoactinobaculum massilliense]
MPKPKKGPRLGGSAAHQRHIVANLCKDLIHHKSVRTTVTRAKVVQPYMEKLITKAKKGDTYNRRLALRMLGDRETAYILFEELAPLFAEREGGYTRIAKVGNRRGDNAPLAVISLVTEKLSPKQAVVREAEKAAEHAAAAGATDDAVEVAEEAPADSADATEAATEDAAK